MSTRYGKRNSRYEKLIVCSMVSSAVRGHFHFIRATSGYANRPVPSLTREATRCSLEHV